ncbi:hypothetical protein WR164_01940 [Philodulcilactobacillus myokoensis]|uniref:Surface layer protein A domain-containing protein n=1 Tax=Philodulcilactobacillus myokoensis TaxID=2929573 RepID=A0A9W6B0A6_9LACO|nr:hypothetical protein [Philodulcilactobacillus myokoensis]GLB46215.1 hypothetical protein WR164_01940 [Philodulcilactobacillus myokoensis]
MLKNTLKYSTAALLALGLLGGSIISSTNASAKRKVRVTRKTYKHHAKKRAVHHVSEAEKNIVDQFNKIIGDDVPNSTLANTGFKSNAKSYQQLGNNLSQYNSNDKLDYSDPSNDQGTHKLFNDLSQLFNHRFGINDNNSLISDNDNIQRDGNQDDDHSLNTDAFQYLEDLQSAMQNSHLYYNKAEAENDKAFDKANAEFMHHSTKKHVSYRLNGKVYRSKHLKHRVYIKHNAKLNILKRSHIKLRHRKVNVDYIKANGKKGWIKASQVKKVVSKSKKQSNHKSVTKPKIDMELVNTMKYNNLLDKELKNTMFADSGMDDQTRQNSDIADNLNTVVVNDDPNNGTNLTTDNIQNSKQFINDLNNIFKGQFNTDKNNELNAENSRVQNDDINSLTKDAVNYFNTLSHDIYSISNN